MKNYFSLISLLALLAVGCNQENIWEKQAISDEGRIFTTSFESDESRTYIENGYLSRWTEDDRISLFDGNTLNRQYKFDGKTGDNSGTFSIVEKPFGTGAILPANYAIYPYLPYSSKTKISENGIITTTLPTLQNYAINSFGLGANTMVAVTQDTDDTFLNFKNVCGCLKVKLYGNDVTVKHITLTGNNNEMLGGEASIIATYGEAPIVIMPKSINNNTFNKSITLHCGQGVKLGNTPETATEFWIVIPPTTFEKGIKLEIENIEGQTFTQSTLKELEIKRNVIIPIAAFNVDFTPYLTFTADAPQTLTMSEAVESLQYSIGGSEWKELGTYTVEFGATNGNLRLRGKNLNGTATSASNSSNIIFGNDASVACSGDIRTLLDYENVETVETKNARFCYLFESCTNLVSAPKLPATSIAESCYYYMFRDCTNLTTAPELPATIVKSASYCGMFEGCTSLLSAPKLPATTLAESCYIGMFSECTSLKAMPELPATTLVKYCYRQMFENCTNLVSVSELPATTLADHCYSSMFEGCTNLVVAPDLPATTLAESCYSSMFDGCTSMVVAPVLPATNLVKHCYEYMFYNCKKLKQITMLAPYISNSYMQSWVYNVSSNGTFVKSKDLTSYQLGFSGIPSKWIVKNYVKE